MQLRAKEKVGYRVLRDKKASGRGWGKTPPPQSEVNCVNMERSGRDSGEELERKV